MVQAIQILIFGLEKCGKSTLICSYQKGHFTSGLPSTAQKIYEITLNGKKFDIIEVGGRKEVRKFVLQFIEHVHAIIFVIDGSKEMSFSEAKQEFDKIVAHPHSLGKPIAVLFHKKDIAQVHPSKIIDRLGILNRYDRPYESFSTSAKNAQYFEQVLLWIHKSLIEDIYPIEDKNSRFLTIYILDMLNEKNEGFPILAILGQLEIISHTGQIEYNRDKIMSMLRQLSYKGEIEYNHSLKVWKITNKGREKLDSSELIKGTKYEKLRTILDEDTSTTSLSNQMKEEVLDEFDIDELAELYKKTKTKKEN